MWRRYRILVGIITCHPISKLGGYLVTFGTISTITYTLMTLFTHGQSPYAGVIFLALVPVAFFGGLMLVPIGIFLRYRHQRRNDPSIGNRPLSEILKTVSGDSDVRGRVIAFALFSGVNVILTFVIILAGFEYLDSASFCGLLCHTVMEPEYVMYQRSPHARVLCIDCHIGPGASWFVKSKISGLRQVYAVMAKTYSRPIPTPIEQLRPSRETCEQCHWPEKFHGDKLKVIIHYDSDRNNTKRYTALLLKVGGPEAEGAGANGIHWHVSSGNRVIFASEKGDRKDIPWIRLESADQPPIEYRLTKRRLTEAQLAELPKRTMECVDCHNRPTHIYRTADEELERMFNRWPDLQKVPWLKKAAGEVLTGNFDDEAVKRKGVRSALLAWYRKRPEENPDSKLLEQAADRVQQIYAQNLWPRMNIRWGTYPNHIGHTVSSGCLRCHGNNHVTAEGKRVRADCRLCHTILALNEQNPPLFDFMAHKEN